ncbi:molybdopterin molybdotransferase MoeA [Dactylosporangium sp. NPDC051484]|uniref:molybdopterin molybdotransferase MoeA n=1 Tax=Dactylosporangium sp. NPDC051484 TaxID=3154942 RepID=UPI0034509C53
MFEAGSAVAPGPIPVPLAESDGLTLAAPLVTLTDLPAFPTSSVDGWAARGPAPWRIVGRVLAGDTAAPLTEDGTCVEIATGGMVPVGTAAIIRVEDSTVADGAVTGEPRRLPDWREQGEEAAAGEELLPAGTPVTPGVIGLAASCGYDTLTCHPAPRAALLVFGDELLTAGTPGAGRVRDALGPSLPSWLRRAGTEVVHTRVPVADTLEDHVSALRAAVDAGAQLICTTGGTMHGPVDHLHPALAELGARYVVNTVAVRPGFPMLVAQLPGGQFVAGLPGNPQSTFVALVSLVLPLLAGLTGRPMPALGTVMLGADVPGRGDYTHLALVTLADGRAHPVAHVGSSMLRGLANSVGFAVIPPGAQGHEGTVAQLVPLPDGERS